MQSHSLLYYVGRATCVQCRHVRRAAGTTGICGPTFISHIRMLGFFGRFFSWLRCVSACPSRDVTTTCLSSPSEGLTQHAHAVGAGYNDHYGTRPVGRCKLLGAISDFFAQPSRNIKRAADLRRRKRLPQESCQSSDRSMAISKLSKDETPLFRWENVNPCVYISCSGVL